MIPVTPQPEPATFDNKVRQKGLNYLRMKGFSLSHPIPKGTKLHPYWRDCLDDLHRSYQGICAYLSVFIERVTGGTSVDHFIAKSRLAGLAYEWSNYRLACSTMNSRKRNYESLLDPFEVRDGWFHLELVSGRVYANPLLPRSDKKAVEDTIKRLGLDDPQCRQMRARHFLYYVNEEVSSDHLRRNSPFVWYEAYRQGLL